MSRTFHALGVAAILGAAAYGINRNISQAHTPIEQRVSDTGEVPIGPSFDDETVPPLHCSRYVRLAAKRLFGIQYINGDAHQLRDDSNVDSMKIKSLDDLYRMQRKGLLQPGDIIGFHNSRSPYANRQGYRDAGYSHVALYTGAKDNTLFVADKFNTQTRTKLDVEGLGKDGWQPTIVLHHKGKRN